MHILGSDHAVMAPPMRQTMVSSLPGGVHLEPGENRKRTGKCKENDRPQAVFLCPLAVSEDEGVHARKKSDGQQEKLHGITSFKVGRVDR